MVIRRYFVLTLLVICLLGLTHASLFGRSTDAEGDVRIHDPKRQEEINIHIRDAQIQHEPSLAEKIQGTAERAGEKIHETLQGTREKLGEYMPSTGGGETYSERLGLHKPISEQVADTARSTKQSAEETLQAARDRASQKTGEYVESARGTTERLGEYVDSMKHSAENIAYKPVEYAQAAKEKLEEVYDATKHKIGLTTERTAETAEGVKQTAQDYTQAAKHKAGEYVESAKQTGQEYAESAKSTGREAAQRVQQACRGEEPTSRSMWSTLSSSPYNMFGMSTPWTGGWRHSKNALQANADIKESAHDIVLHMDLPGLHPNDIDVTLSKNLLTVKGHREYEEEKEDEHYHLYERDYGSFSRSFRLPDDLDAKNILASYENGVLEVVVPKIQLDQKIETLSVPIKSHEPVGKPARSGWKLPFLS